VLDKASLRLGDNTTVNFDRTLIFLTSNLGAQGMANELRPGLGFERPVAPVEERRARLETVATSAMKRKFTPEFVNRIDKVITYQPLDRPALERILGLELDEIQRHIDRRLTARAFQLEVPLRARRALLDQGTSAEYGARELKRTLQRSILQPLAALVADNRIAPGSTVRVEFDGQEFVLDPPSSQAA
jgi:ATP-dependent Clp protease ATP-binding subunit ClpA